VPEVAVISLTELIFEISKFQVTFLMYKLSVNLRVDTNQVIGQPDTNSDDEANGVGRRVTAHLRHE
jgi:hypothetical protein